MRAKSPPSPYPVMASGHCPAGRGAGAALRRGGGAGRLRGDDLSEALAASAPQRPDLPRGLPPGRPDQASPIWPAVDSSADSAAGELFRHFAELFGLSLSD